MSKILTLDEMREVIAEIDPEAGARAAAAMKALGDVLAAEVCRLAKVQTNAAGVTVEPCAFAGTAAPFFRIKGQKPHKAILQYDEGEPLEHLE